MCLHTRARAPGRWTHLCVQVFKPKMDDFPVDIETSDFSKYLKLNVDSASHLQAPSKIAIFLKTYLLPSPFKRPATQTPYKGKRTFKRWYPVLWAAA